MARWDTAQFEEVVSQKRLDGEYHSHPAKYLDKRLRLSGNLELHQIRNCCQRITSGHTPLRHRLTEGKVFFVTVECVSPLHLPVNKLGNLLIHKLDEQAQTEIDVIIKERFLKLAESEAAYTQAQQLLEEAVRA